MDREERLIQQGERVEQIISREGLSQADFSSLTGIKTSTLNHVVKGRNDISPQVMNQILAIFPKYSEKWIRTGEGEIMREYNGDLFSQSTVTSSSIGNQNNLLDNQGFSSLQPNESTIKSKKIIKIIVYYDDNTFETFNHAD